MQVRDVTSSLHQETSEYYKIVDKPIDKIVYINTAISEYKLQLSFQKEDGARVSKVQFP